MRRLAISAAAALAIAAAVPADAQTLRIALRQDTDVVDPTLTTTYVGRIVFAGLCDKLFDIDEKLNIVPQLAAGHKWDDDRTLTIALKPDLKFHNGEDLDAEAVRYTFDRNLNLQGSYRRSEIASVDRVEVVDKLTARIHLKAPSGAFLAQLTDRSGMPLPPKAAEAAGKDFGRAPVCSGPFKFVERVAQDHIALEKFAAHRDAASIHFDRVTYRVLVDSSIRLANLKSGAIDLSEYIAANDAAQVKADAKLRLVVTDALGYVGLTNNLANGPKADNPYGRDARVRQALDLAIDRAALIQVVFNGLYNPTVQAVPPASPFHDPKLAPPARDVAKAKALLKEAGVALPVKLELMTPNEPDSLQAAEVIQSMAAEAGFEIKIQATEFASSLSAGQRGDYQAYLIGWSGRVDIDGNVYQFLRSGQGNNYSKYASAKMDSLLDEARGSVDAGKRRALYAEAAALARADLPLTYMWNPKNIVGHSARLQGFKPVPDGMIRVRDLRMAP
jgi:peptide/nickel transport system substrate-binding protein